jgi:hypothetical protein
MTLRFRHFVLFVTGLAIGVGIEKLLSFVFDWF